MDNAMLNIRTQHGEFVLTTNGNVLIARLSGSWNEEAARLSRLVLSAGGAMMRPLFLYRVLPGFR